MACHLWTCHASIGSQHAAVFLNAGDERLGPARRLVNTVPVVTRTAVTQAFQKSCTPNVAKAIHIFCGLQRRFERPR